MHPEQARACVDAWKEQQKREDYRSAALQLIIAQSQGVKIGGRKCTLNDFLPKYARPKRAGTEELMKEAEQAIRAQKGIVKQG